MSTKCSRPDSLFQPTLPARGATCFPKCTDTDSAISIHAPRTGSDAYEWQCFDFVQISIHAPRTGSDRWRCLPRLARTDFNPRSPHGERRQARRHPRRPALISIHAPRTGSDGISGACPFSCICISIHAPRTGSDLRGEQSALGSPEFQSTLPARGATLGRRRKSKS